MLAFRSLAHARMAGAPVILGGGAREWNVTPADKGICCKHWRPQSCNRSLTRMIVPGTATGQQGLPA
jgi:hypothetical protein